MHPDASAAVPADLSPEAFGLLRYLAGPPLHGAWSLLKISRIAAELEMRGTDLLVLLHELEAARLVQHWPLGSQGNLTDGGRELLAAPPAAG